MSEFFKAAARCDITIVKDSPVPLDEKEIIEGEIKARQWDTLGSKIEVEKEIYDEIRNVQLDKQRQREQEERMRKLRLEEKRKLAVEKKETERLAKLEMQKQKTEDMELQRISVIEAKRQELAADRAKARAKMEEKAYQDVQRRLQTSSGAKTLEEQADSVDPENLTYLDRIRIEKERLGRMSQHYSHNSSITALYDSTSVDGPSGRRTKTRLEEDLMKRREMERKRIEEEHARILAEDEEDEQREKRTRKEKHKQKKTEHEGWLTTKQREEEEERRLQQAQQEAEEAKKNKKHPIDDMHKLVEKEFMEEQEALAVVDENLTLGYSHLDRLEQFMDAEKDAWRDQVQFEREIQYEQSAMYN